jgi:hypothetical protein
VSSPGGLNLELTTYPPLKRWAIIFRARGARVVPVSSSRPNPAGRKAGPSARTEVLGRDDNKNNVEDAALNDALG